MRFLIFRCLGNVELVVFSLPLLLLHLFLFQHVHQWSYFVIWTCRIELLMCGFVHYGIEIIHFFIWSQLSDLFIELLNLIAIFFFWFEQFSFQIINNFLFSLQLFIFVIDDALQCVNWALGCLSHTLGFLSEKCLLIFLGVQEPSCIYLQLTTCQVCLQQQRIWLRIWTYLAAYRTNFQSLFRHHFL